MMTSAKTKSETKSENKAETKSKKSHQKTDYRVSILTPSTNNGYGGDVSPSACWAALEAAPNAVLVDVRTKPEWVFVGAPDLQALGKKTHFIEWQVFPAMALNENFIQMLETVAPDKTAPVFFICRSGARSIAAAQAAQGAAYAQAYNIAGGFEGACDAHGQRGRVDGWKHEKMAWRQA